jgi:hypothetical protein
MANKLHLIGIGPGLKISAQKRLRYFPLSWSIGYGGGKSFVFGRANRYRSAGRDRMDSMNDESLSYFSTLIVKKSGVEKL